MPTREIAPTADRFTVDVISPNQLDFDEYVALQRAAFAEVVGPSGMAGHITPEVYRWKYLTPFGAARIATVRLGTTLVASNAMYPLQAVYQGQRTHVWQSCDTATHPSARGQGHFMRCLHALTQHLGTDGVFLGFPNANSTKGFLKLGWTLHTELRTWVHPVVPVELLGHPALTRLTSLGEDWDRLHERLAVEGPPMLVRSAEYLRWRYQEHPEATYELYGAKTEDRLTGLLVIRKVRLFGHDVALVMEMMGSSPCVERRLLAQAAKWSRANGCRFAVALTGWCRRSPFLRSGYLPAPSRLLPKRQVLMGAPYGPSGERIWAEPWRLGLGDWDVF